MTAALLDTSALIATETGRAMNPSATVDELRVSVITIGELLAGVHAAADTETRSRRLATLERATGLSPLPADERAASEWARLRHRLRESGRRIPVNDLWIAAIALANSLPVVTQDNDFDVLVDLGGPQIIRV